MTRHILGVSAFYHDSAAALLTDGRIVAAAQEERFTRKKGDASFPSSAIAYCLRAGAISVDDLAAIAFYDKSLLKFERILETYLGVAPRGIRSFTLAAPVWLKDKLLLDRYFRKQLGYRGKVLCAEHHESHAASAFFPSPFTEAAILTVDGVGEWATASYGLGKDADIELLRELRFPHSLGLLYSAFTDYIGFKVNSGEYKVMGLAPYGEPKYVDVILGRLMDLKDDGSFKLDMKYFDYLSGLRMTSPAFHRLFGGPPREPETRLTQRDMDLARSIQVVCEEVMLRMARSVHEATGQRNLCLAGGVALNCVANGRILREGPFERLWIQPAAGDAGSAVGVALLAHHRYFGEKRVTLSDRDGMQAALLGPEFGDAEIEAFLAGVGASYRRLDRGALVGEVAERLAGEAIVGWFQGRMEFGPRALGNRSILGDPRSPRMQAHMNLKIKFREGFRPFAPSVLRERVSDYFELEVESPYMLLVAPVRRERRIPMSDEARRLWGIDRLNVARSDIPAVTHVDDSARIQTVTREENPLYHDLVRAFEARTGCGVLVNTSFNVRGEPLVCDPADAYRCFMRTRIDHLAIGSFLLDKDAQPPWREPGDWRREIPRD